MSGGYQIIDLKGVNHTAGSDSGGVLHEGIYDLISGTRKPILMTNVVINGLDFHDRFVDVDYLGKDFYLYFMNGTRGYRAVVKNNDIVTFNSVS